MFAKRLSLRPRAMPSVRCRRYTAERQRSPHAQWYSDIWPSMIPIFLLGSAIYLGLELTQLKLSHEKYMDESAKRIEQLEDEIAKLRQKRLDQLVPTQTIQGEIPNPSSKKRSSWW